MQTGKAAQASSSVIQVASFDLMQESANMEQRKPWASGLFAKTLHKTNDLRIVLISMEAGARLKEHHVDGASSVQVIVGTIQFATAEDTYKCAAGRLLALRASTTHAVLALQKSVLLLTISWPDSAHLAAIEHRGYGA